MIELVSSGIAHVGVEQFTVTKERSEVVAFTDPLGFMR
jgi:ABC-type amino acid transport substrate-binding protein